MEKPRPDTDRTPYPHFDVKLLPPHSTELRARRNDTFSFLSFPRHLWCENLVTRRRRRKKLERFKCAEKCPVLESRVSSSPIRFSHNKNVFPIVQGKNGSFLPIERWEWFGLLQVIFDFFHALKWSKLLSFLACNLVNCQNANCNVYNYSLART